MLLASHPLFGVHPPTGYSSARRSLYIRDLVCDAAIGVYHHEKERKQKISIDLCVEVDNPTSDVDDTLSNVLDYDDLRQGIVAILERGHIQLQETLAEAIADFCLAVRSVRAVYVRIGKLEAMAGCAAVGCELVRRKAL